MQLNCHLKCKHLIAQIYGKFKKRFCIIWYWSVSHVQISQAQLNSQRGKIKLNKMNEASSPLFILCPPKMNTSYVLREYFICFKRKTNYIGSLRFSVLQRDTVVAEGKEMRQYINTTQTGNNYCKTIKAYILLLHT